ncbi:MAG: hypothetical protein K2H44_02175 [Muribaculaceae bacterium]|nr:hypothetical protein [Muribaculaceae bacterium]
MNEFFRLRFTALVAVVAALLLAMTACDDDIEVNRSNSGFVKIRLNVDNGKNSAQSRAGNKDPNGFYDPEGDYENISSLRILIIHNIQNYNVGGVTQYMGGVEVNKLVSTAPDGTPLVDKLEFIVENNQDKRFYLIANEDALPNPRPTQYSTTRQFLDSYVEQGQANLALLENWVVEAPHSGSNLTGAIFSNIDNGVMFPGIPLTERFDIPISGTPVTVSTNDGQSLPSMLEGEAIQVNLFLTRAAAKARFSFEVDPNYYGRDISVVAVRLENLNYTEYVFPRETEYYPSKYIDGDGGEIFVNYVPDAKRWITDFTTYREVTEQGPGVFTYYPLTLPTPLEIKAGSQLSNVGPIYFPEAKGRPGDAKTQNIGVSLLLSGTNEWLQAKYLGGPSGNVLTIGDLQAIARNTFLDIDINFGEAGITWRANVAPYNTATLKPTFGWKPTQSDPNQPQEPGEN